MGRTGEQWHERVEPHFGFLADIGFGAVDVDVEGSPWSTWAQYRSATAAVRVSKSNEFVRCEVHLIRLVDGEVPAYPIWITDARIDWALLDNVVQVRRPDLMAEVTRQTGLSEAKVEDQLIFWAQVLLEVAGDFLTGSFAALDEAAALIRSRVAEHPQQVQVWIPDDASEASAAAQVEDVTRTVPPEVGVSVRRFRRGRRRWRGTSG